MLNVFAVGLPVAFIAILGLLSWALDQLFSWCWPLKKALYRAFGL